MARAWVVDLWVKDALVEMPDGTTIKVSATSSELRSISKIPDRFKTSKFGRGKRWKVAWYEDVEGTQRQRAKLYESKRDADALAASLDEDIRVGRYLQPENGERLYRDVSASWLVSKRRIKESTYFNYEKALRSYILPKWGGSKISRITRESIDTWVSELQSGTAPVKFDESFYRAAKPLGPSAIKNIVQTVFSAVLNFAVSQKWISENPTKLVELPRVPRTPVKETLSHEEVEEMAKAAQAASGEYRDYVAVHMLTYAAPRINELFALQKMHLDLSAMRATIEQTWTRAKEGGRKLGSPKNGDTRVVPVADHLLPMLETLVKDQPETAFVFRQAGSHSALWDRNWHNRVWTPAGKSTGLSKRFGKFSPHVLRHTGITFAIAAGADVKIVQAMAGHRSIEETMNTYGKLFPDRLDEVRKLMSDHRARSIAPRLTVIDGTR